MPTNRLWTYLISLIVLVLLIWSFFVGAAPKPQSVSITDIVTLVDQHKVRQITVDHATLTAEQTDGTKVKAFKEESVSLTQYGLTPDKVAIAVVDPNKGTLWSSFFSVPAVAITVAPRCLAIWIAIVPNPPAPPQIKKVCPALRSPTVTSP